MCIYPSTYPLTLTADCCIIVNLAPLPSSSQVCYEILYCTLAKIDPITVVHIALPAKTFTEAKKIFPNDPPFTVPPSLLSGSYIEPLAITGSYGTNPNET